MSMQSSGLSRVLSTAEDVQHCGEISSVLWVIPSDLWRMFSAVEGFCRYGSRYLVLLGDTISTVEYVQCCCGLLSVLLEVPTVLLWIFSTVIGYH